MVPFASGHEHLVVAGWNPNFIRFSIENPEHSTEDHAKRVGTLATMLGSSYYAALSDHQKGMNEEQFMAAFAEEVNRSAGLVYRKK
jgi:hypothetical protein